MFDNVVSFRDGHFVFQVKLHHPVSDDLAFLYGTILTDGHDNYSSDATANICVFAEAQVLQRPRSGDSGGVWSDYTLELPPLDASLEAGPCPSHWERGGDETGRANSSHRSCRCCPGC